MIRKTPPFYVCVHVVLALPSVLGAWSTALVLWLPCECYYFFYTTVLCCTQTHRISFFRQSLFHSKNHIICTCTKVECRESVPGDCIQEGVSQEIEMFGVNDRKFQSTKQSLPMATFHFFLYGFNF